MNASQVPPVPNALLNSAATHFPPQARSQPPKNKNEIPLDDFDRKSIIYIRMGEDLLKVIKRALVDRAPPTYRRVYRLFELDVYNITFSAFYYYARRVRTDYNVHHFLESMGMTSQCVHDLLPDILGHRLLEMAVNPRASMQQMRWLSDVYHVTTQSDIRRKRFAAARADREQDAQLKAQYKAWMGEFERMKALAAAEPDEPTGDDAHA